MPRSPSLAAGCVEGCTRHVHQCSPAPRTAGCDRITKQGHRRCDWSGRGHSGAGGPNPVLAKRGHRPSSGGRPGRRRQRWGVLPPARGRPGLQGAPEAGRRTRKAPPQREPAPPTPPSQTSGLPNQERSRFQSSQPSLWPFLPQPRTLTCQAPGCSRVSGHAAVTCTRVLLGPARASPTSLTWPWSPCPALTPVSPAAPGHPSLPRPPAPGQGPGSRHQPMGSAGPRDPQGFGP